MKMFKSDSDPSTQIQLKSRSSLPIKGSKQFSFEAILKYLQKEGSLINSICKGTQNFLNFHSQFASLDGIKEQLIHLEKGLRAFNFPSSNQEIYRINFASTMDDDKLNFFSNKIVHHLKSISKLELTFELCDYVSNKALMNLGLQIRRHLKHLKHLKLHFKRNSQITTPCVEQFGSLLSKRLTKLEVFSLSFTSFSLLHSQCSKSINLGLEKNLRNLKRSAFQFLESFNIRGARGDHFPTYRKPRYTKNLTSFQVWTPGLFSEDVAGTILKYLFKNPETVLNFQACSHETGRSIKIIRTYEKDGKKDNNLPVLNAFAKAGEWGPEHFMRALGAHSEYRTVRVQRIVIQNTVQSEKPLSKAEQNQITIHIDYTRNSMFENSNEPLQRMSLNFKGFASLTKGFFQAFQQMIAPQNRVLKELVMNLKGFREIGGGEDFGDLGRNGIPNLQNLEKLTLSLKNCGVTSSKYEMLMKNLASSLKKLERLDLSFKELLVLFGDKDLAAFTKYFNSLANLKSLRLNLSNLKISDKGIESLLRNLGNNGALEDLCVHGEKCRVTEKSLELFGGFVAEKPNLRKLEVSFKGCGLAEKAVQGFLDKIHKNCPQLNLAGGWLEEEISKIVVENGEKSLFELQDGKFTAEQFGKVMDSLLRNKLDLDKFEKLPFFCVTSGEIKAYLEQTKELSYICRGSEIPQQLSAQDFDFLARNLLAHLKNIESLDLDFSQTEMNPFDFINFFKNFSSIGLSEISLKLSLEKLGGDIFIELDKAIAENLKNLKKLSLDLKVNNGLKKEEIKSFGNQMSAQLKNLEVLRLKLRGCELTCEGVELFAKEMNKEFTRLKRFELGFEESKLVENGEALRRFAQENFKMKSKLTEFVLNLKNSQTTEEIIEELLSEIENNAEGLETFKLNLVGCKGITSKFQKTWIERLRCKSISKVNIELNNE